MLGHFFILSKEVKALCLISKEKSQILYQIELIKIMFFNKTQYLLKSFQMVVI